MKHYRGWLLALCLLALIAGVRPAQAHPLGNFTINHLVKVDVRDRAVDVRYILDMAEIPTFQLMRSQSENATMDAAQLRTWAGEEIDRVAPSLLVAVDGKRVALKALRARASTRPGAGGLPTMYWVADFRAAKSAGPGRITVDDQTFPGRIGWKDVVVAPSTEPTDELRRYPSALVFSPRNVTAVAITLTSRGFVVDRTPTSASSERSIGAPPASMVRSNALSDMLAHGTGNPWFVILTLLAAVGLGALHAAEPGHGKTLLAVSLVGARATPRQAVLLAAGLTIAHTAGVLMLGGALLVAARWIVPETIYPWITLLSGIAVTVLGANALARFVRARRGRNHAHEHEHEHLHGHSHDISGNEPLSFRGVMLVAMSGNIAPCPAALVVLLAALALHEVGYGLAVVVAFSVGLAAVLTGLGIALVRGAAWISKRPSFDTLTAYAPLASACVISLIGAIMLGQGATAGAFDAPPLAVTALALSAIAAFAFAPGHDHAHGHARNHVHVHAEGASR